MAQDQQQVAAMDPRFAGLSIAVVGAGRIGAELIRHLTHVGFGRVDVYEADAEAAESLRSRHTVHEGDFWDELTLARLRDYDFAICTLQDPAARVRMNQKCLVANVSLVQAWTDETHAMVAAFPFGLHGDCACYECDADRPVTPMPLASLKLSVAGASAEGSPVATASVAGALGAALTARVASGAHGSLARRASLDTTSGEGASVELRRDPECSRCRGLERPVPIVHTRNCWKVSACVAESFPETLDQSVQLSDDIDDMPGHSFRVGELVERFRGGPIPAKFALAAVEGRVVCLDFEDLRDEAPQRPSSR
jgi:hypothetical protein